MNDEPGSGAVFRAKESLGRHRLPIRKFNDLCIAGEIVDPMVETLGDGYGEPYNPYRIVHGRKGKKVVWAIRHEGGGKNCDCKTCRWRGKA